MPISAISLYLQALPKRLAELRMILAEGATVPHMERDARENWMDALRGTLEDGQAERKVLTPGQLKLLGIGFKRVKAHG